MRIEHNKASGGGVAQVALASMRPQVQTPVPPKQNKTKRILTLCPFA
jgi:hypothetical protein